ncbi:MAG: DUF502 domain-containing protein, partial [Planctomycetota bacterium]
MSPLLHHLTRCVVAGFVALLPLLGMALSLFFVEAQLSSSWLARQNFYVPGMGIALALVMVYVVGLFVTTFVGRWLWRIIDRGLERLPVVGMIYQSLKQVLGYDTQRERFFQSVVLVRTVGGEEIGLVTGTTPGPDGEERTMVFVPGSPNPANGRLLLLHKNQLTTVNVNVAHALRTLVA